jgi:hypothetical protein
MRSNNATKNASKIADRETSAVASVRTLIGRHPQYYRNGETHGQDGQGSRTC